LHIVVGDLLENIRQYLGDRQSWVGVQQRWMSNATPTDGPT